MNYKIVTLLFLLLIPISGTCQEEDLEFLSKELCSMFHESDLEKSKTELFDYLQLKSNQVYQKFDNKVSSLKKNFETLYPNKDEIQIAQIIAQNISFKTIENCQEFMRISQKVADFTYDKNKKSALNVSNKICSVMEENKSKNYNELTNLVDNRLFDIALTEKRMIEKEFGQFGGQEFYNEVTAILMTQCEIYFKMAMHNQKKKISPNLSNSQEDKIWNSISLSDGEINQPEFDFLLAKTRVLISDFIHADYEAIGEKLGVVQSEIKESIGKYLTDPNNRFNEQNQNKYITPVFRKTDLNNQLELTVFACEILAKKKNENFSRGNYYFTLTSKVSLFPEQRKIQFEDVRLISSDMEIQKWWLGQYKDYMVETKKIMESYGYKMPPPPPPPMNLK